MSLYDTDSPTMAIGAAFTSPNESDSNGEPANVVDGLFAIARSINDLAAAIREGQPPGPILAVHGKLTDEEVLAIRKRFAQVAGKDGRT